ncbi:MAG: DUF4173 domain-containing protein [Gemmatimonadota bacterium]
MNSAPMNTQQSLDRPRVVVWLGLFTGIIADLLLRAEPPGLNLLLFGVLLGLALLVLQRTHRIALPRTSGYLIILAVVCLSSFVLRDSPALNFFSLVSAFAALSLAAYRAQAGVLATGGTLQYVGALLRNSLGTWLGILPLVIHDVRWQRTDRSSRWASVGRGLLLALPPVIVFAALFASADPIFGNLISFDMNTVISHGFVIGLGVWLSAGYGRELLLARSTVNVSVPDSARAQWGFTETTILLGAVNAIFLAFVVVQIRTLFGGDAFVESQTGLTYAEYARRGFFDLVLVSALVLPLLLVVEWYGRRSSSREETTFRALSHLLLLLLFAVLLSAVQRMRIYQLSYGMTELRVYTMAFMVWLALVFTWLAVTVLRERRSWFASGATVLALLVLAGLHLADPDQVIMQVNLERASRGLAFDTEYAATLSDDAVPSLVGALPALAPDAGCRVLGNLAVRQERRAGAGWRTFNISRSRATRLISSALRNDPARTTECEATVRAEASRDRRSQQ